MDLRPGENIIFEGHPCWRFLMRFYFLGIVEAAVIFIVWRLFGSTGQAILVAFAFLAGVFLIGFLRRYFTMYKITNRRIWIATGIIARHTQEARMDRVQNVSTDQGPIERIFRFGDVDFDTAGHDGESDFIFRGVGDPSQVVQAIDQVQHAAEEEASRPQRSNGGLSNNGLDDVVDDVVEDQS